MRRTAIGGRCASRRCRRWFLSRSSLVPSLMTAVASLMATGAPPLPPLHPVGSGCRRGRGGGRGGGRGLCYGLCFGL